ncbi:hypothetical protein K440DRAFT_657232 [Wilcoxina mikolae CBS 423.85]|nr:hypothetical protein K440DRAFT_657232 [Wilcoxina mikolae CBS 423.85]
MPWMLTAVARLTDSAPEVGVVIPIAYVMCHQPASLAEGLKGIATHIRIEVQMGEPRFQYQGPNDPRYYSSVIAGVGIGVAETGATGTLGGYVFDKETGRRYGITNVHVCGAQYVRTGESLPFLLDRDYTVIRQNSDGDHRRIVDDARRQWVQAQKASDDVEGGIPKLRERARKAEEALKETTTRKRNFGVVSRAELSLAQNDQGTKSWKDVSLIKVANGRLGPSTFSSVPTDKSVDRHVSTEEGMAVRKAAGRNNRRSKGNHQWFPY